MFENTLYKLQRDKTLTIGYFGGSITEGEGSSDPEKTCWRAKHTAWMQEHFPEAKITAVAAAIGGTGTDLGAYRCEDDLLAKDPDLVFVEFAVNDFGRPYAHCMSHFEAILRKIYRHNPYADVVVVFTLSKMIYDYMCTGYEFPSRAAHSAIAHAYPVSTILNVGPALLHAVERAGGDWLTHTIDTLHPNDAGYQIYADLIIGKFEKNLLRRTAPLSLKAHTMPAPVSPSLPEEAHLVPAKEALPASGWQGIERPLCRRYPDYIESDEVGAILTFRFTGQRIGLYAMFAMDGGHFHYRIDGGDWKEGRLYDKWCLQFDRANCLLLEEDLPMGDHVLELFPNGEAPETSRGHFIRIGAFMVG